MSAVAARSYGLLLLSATLAGCQVFEPKFDECTHDDQCGGGMLCAHGWLGKRCTSQGSACDIDEHCPLELECRFRGEDWLLERSQRTCEPRLCQCDSDCPKDFACGDGAPLTSSRHCVPAEPPCRLDTDCKAGSVCSVHPSSQCPEMDQRSCRMIRCWCDASCPAGTLCSLDDVVCRPGVRAPCAEGTGCEPGAPCVQRARFYDHPWTCNDATFTSACFTG